MASLILTSIIACTITNSTLHILTSNDNNDCYINIAKNDSFIDEWPTNWLRLNLYENSLQTAINISVSDYLIPYKIKCFLNRQDYSTNWRFCVTNNVDKMMYKTLKTNEQKEDNSHTFLIFILISIFSLVLVSLCIGIFIYNKNKYV